MPALEGAFRDVGMGYAEIIARINRTDRTIMARSLATDGGWSYKLQAGAISDETHQTALDLDAVVRRRVDDGSARARPRDTAGAIVDQVLEHPVFILAGSAWAQHSEIRGRSSRQA
jgi:hypothetical protein